MSISTNVGGRPFFGRPIASKESMNDIDSIKFAIKKLYESDPNIHMTIKLLHPKIVFENIPTKIIGVYRNIFQVEESNDVRSTRHSFQYGDILIGRITIPELNYTPPVPPQN